MEKNALHGNRLFTVLEYLKIRKFDKSTPEGRQSERYQRGLLTSLANLLSKGSGIMVLVISVPLTLPYLGQERFGIWMTLASLTAMFSFFDFGIGNVLLNAVARKNGKNCHQKSIAFVATNGLVLLSIISIALFTFLTFVVLFLYKNNILLKNINFIYDNEIFNSLIISIFFICINIPISAIYKIFLGMQQGYVAYIFNTLANFFSIILLLYAPTIKYDIPELILITFGAQIMISFALIWRMYFNNNLQFGLVRISRISKISMHMFRSGSIFFALQLAAVVGWGSDLLLISALLGPSHVATFVIAQRMFQFVTQPVSLLLQPLWATYAEASVRGDRSYIRTTLFYSCAITLIVAAGVSTTIFVFHEFILDQWVGSEAVVPTALVLGFAIWTVLESCGIALAMFLNGTSIMRPQLYVTIFFCVIILPLKVFAILKFGLSSVIFVTIATYVVSVVIPYSTIFRHHIVEKIRE